MFYPYITIAIPVYNRTSFFVEAVESALNQTVTVAIIIVDNASETDFFKNYVSNSNRPNLKYYRNETNVGMVGNWNKCIDLCETEWLSILHDDDALAPTFVEYIVTLINKFPANSVYVTGWESGETTKLLYSDHVETPTLTIIKPHRFLFHSISPFPGVVFSKKLGLKFDESLHPVADIDFWYRLSQIKPIIASNKLLAFYRQSPLQASSSEYIGILEALYLFRKEKIGFSNFLVKTFSIFELYKLNLMYSSLYKSSQALISFKYEELNTYFNFYRSSWRFSIVNILYKFFKLHQRITEKNETDISKSN